MPSNKKRKADDKRSGVSPGASGSRRGRRVGKIDRNNSSAATSGRGVFRRFMDKMTVRLHTELLAVKNKFMEYLRDAIEPSDFACNEVIRVESAIRRRYDFSTRFDVVAMGNNDSLQLGIYQEIGEKDTSNPPLMVNLEPQHRISAGGMHSVTIRGGVVKDWGSSDEGTLGREGGDFLHESTPSVVEGFVTSQGVNEDGQIMAVAAGNGHILFLSLSGNVYQCGRYKTDKGNAIFRDMQGLGESPSGFNEKPVHVTMPGKVLGIYTSGSFNAALLENDTIVTWGFGDSGELARSANMTNPDRNGKFDVGQAFQYNNVQDEKGKVVSSELNVAVVKEHFLTPKPVIYAGPQVKKTVISVAAGGCHLLVAARNPGQSMTQLYSSGQNLHGQCGHGDTENRHELTPVMALSRENISMVAAGSHHSLALTHDRKRLYAFGRADYSQLGIGYVETGGQFPTPQPVYFEEETFIEHIECGDSHSAAITDNHEVYTWGFGEMGSTGHVTVEGEEYEDILRPRKLDLTRHVDADIVKVHDVSCGGQHTLMLVERLRKS